jgi:pimeloyl-ACP methyl ester carboxylesterase
MRTFAPLLFLAALAGPDGERDNQADNVRRIPPPGIAVPDADRAELVGAAEELGKEIAALRNDLKGKPALDLLPDVQVYHKAIDWALRHNEIFNAREIPAAKLLARQGLERARQLKAGAPGWVSTRGPLVLGYLSRIDGSVQPYGLVVPLSWSAATPHRFRLDTWFHGRGETLSELAFLDQRLRSPGEFVPRDAFVLHPYGRYCNANKLAGETDLFEALEDVKRRYPIDESRIVVRGFSMGGAACWQFAAHYPGHWAAAAPGAGFSETPDFLKVFQNETLKPTPWEVKLWHLYDCTDYALNFFNLPVVAYSGEIDKQRQAADVMAAAMMKEGLDLVHVIGPKTGHQYHPEAKAEINRRIDAIAAAGRPALPRQVRFTTWTLRYHECRWVRIDGLERHWERATVAAEIPPGNRVKVSTSNVSALSLQIPPGLAPFEDPTRPVMLTVDDQRVASPAVASDRSWTARLRKLEGKWAPADPADDARLRKRPGLQGPIDDAFMDSFLFVRPTGGPMNEKIGAWVAKEMEHAIVHWRQQFRGDARVTDDAALKESEISQNHLVLWGDPSSNRILGRIADKLPIRWTPSGLAAGEQTFPAETHVPVFIFPNPLNPKRYVVVNSGFTYREYAYLNNARQVPKLPDWAVLDVTTPPSSQWPGKVVAADFFDEEWRLK